MNWILKILLSAVVVFCLSHIIPGVIVTSYFTSIIVAIVLALLNTFIKPVLVILTIPITLITLGLFLIVINAIIILLASYFIDGFFVSSIWVAIIFSILLSIFQSILHKLVKTDKTKK